MDKYISKGIRSNLQKLGIYQIIGGAIGVLLVLLLLVDNSQLTGLNVLVILFMLLFFAYSILCGILCLKLKDTALKHSLINQLLQVGGFAAFGFSFKYVAGAFLTIGLDLTNSIEFIFGAGLSKLSFNINNEPERMEVTFNLVAIGLIYWIDQLTKKINTQKELQKIAELSEK